LALAIQGKDREEVLARLVELVAGSSQPSDRNGVAELPESAHAG
jgi:hypothetical protein